MLIDIENIVGNAGFVDMSNLSSGTYIIKIENGQEVITRKAIKK